MVSTIFSVINFHWPNTKNILKVSCILIENRKYQFMVTKWVRLDFYKMWHQQLNKIKLKNVCLWIRKSEKIGIHRTHKQSVKFMRFVLPFYNLHKKKILRQNLLIILDLSQWFCVHSLLAQSILYYSYAYYWYTHHEWYVHSVLFSFHFISERNAHTTKYTFVPNIIWL